MIATLAPSRAARSAIARPMPRLPPDMKMVHPFRSLTDAPAYWRRGGRAGINEAATMRGLMALKLGYKASAEQFGPRELLEYSVLAEELGYDSVVVSDHFQPWRHEGGHAPFSFAWMGALGERTSRALLGTSEVAPSYRY